MRATSSKKKERQGKIKRTAALMLFLFLFIGLPVAFPGGGIVSAKNPGLKYYRNYSPDDYGFDPQNWCLVQNQNGIIYVANNGGIEEYDGNSRNSIKVSNQTVLSLAVDGTGTVYVGGTNELGFLASNATNQQGKKEYKSLVEYIEKDARNFGNVWRCHATDRGIFFRTSKYLFQWLPQQKQMKILLKSVKGEADRINGSFDSGGRFFIKQVGAGLMELENHALKPVPGGEILSAIRVIFMVVPYQKFFRGPGGDFSKKPPGRRRHFLIGTRDEGFFIYDGEAITHFPTEVEGYLRENRANHGIMLEKSPGEMAIATLSGGLVIMNREGKIKQCFTKETGLLDDNVKYVYEDTQGNLWAALNYGVAKIEYASPLSIYDNSAGLPGMVYSVTRLADEVYAGTSEGLFYLGGSSGKFSQVPGMVSSCWSLLTIGEMVLAAADTGVYQVQNHVAGQLISAQSFVLLGSRRDPNRVWVGMGNTLGSLYLRSDRGKNQWTVEKPIKVEGEIRTMVEDADGDLWLGTRPSGVIRVVFSTNGDNGGHKIITYGPGHGLPPGNIQVCWAAGHVVFGSKENVLRFDEGKNTDGEKLFIPDSTLGKGKEFSGRITDVYRVVEDRDGSIWIHAKGRNYQAIPKPEGTYDIQEKPLARIPINAQVNAIYPDPVEKVTWFASHKGLIRFDPGVKKEYRHEYTTVIRKVSVNGNPRYYDIFTPFPPLKIPGAGGNAKPIQSAAAPVFSYEERNIRFEFAAPFFEDEARVSYSYKLEGYEDRWTNQSKEFFKEYTNLDAGEYTFRVKGENIYGNRGREAAFKFRILPPWYGTWWALLGYVLLFFLALFLTVKWRSGKLRQEKKRLEQLVNERTGEIHRKSRQLEEQTLILREQAEQLKELDHTKSRFFANISHEFRTPLTLILGPLEQILSYRLPEGIKNQLSLMQQNSHRLLGLINRLLDLSRIDSGKMKLRAAPREIISFLKGILAAFEHPAKEKKLTLEFQTPGEPFTLYFDAEKMEEIVTNLISNAVKFTPSGGKITVSVREFPGKDVDFPLGSLEVTVRDTGIGIPREQVAHLFNRFFQVESHERKHKGSGIGLALTRELVLLHHGKIDVNSKVGEESGSEFILRFPLGKAHLKPEEIVDPPCGAGSLSEFSSSTSALVNDLLIDSLVPPLRAKSQELSANSKSPRGLAEGINATVSVTGVSYDTGSTADTGATGESFDTGKIGDKEIEGFDEAALEIEKPGPGNEPAPAPKKKAPPEQKPTVLVVEDSAGMRQFIRESIDGQYTVIEAEDGIEGTLKAQEFMPDLVISDIMMPQKDGFELCRDLKTDIKTSHIPVILLTAKAEVSSKVQGLETGADDYIIKPFNMKILQTRIKNLIDLRRQLQEKIKKQMLLQPDEIKISSMDQRFIDQLHGIIEESLSDSELNVEYLSQKMDISRVTLNKKIMALTGETALEFIRSYRLKRAMQLLKDRFGNVLEVAEEVGFSSPSHFAKCFKEKFHQLPSEI